MTPEQVALQLRFMEAAGLQIGPACSLDGWEDEDDLFSGDPEPVCPDDGLPDVDPFDDARAADEVGRYDQ